MSCRKQHFIWFGLSIAFGCNAALAAEITSIDFKGTADPSEITIQADGPIPFDKQENQQDKQIVLEFKGTTISKSNTRKIDTSSFNSKVSLISPYQVDGQPNTVRVVVQLREFVAADVSQDGNTVRIKVPSGAGGTAAAADSPSPADSGNKPPTDANAPSPPQDVAANDAPSADSSSSVPKSEPSDGKPKSKLDEFVENSGSHQFSGKPITLQLRDADLSDVFRLIGDASGFNIIVGDDVKGKITMSLTEVPWDQALDVILHSARLGAERSNSILRIATLVSLTQEKVDELNAKQAAQANTPQVTKVFSINYANLSDLQGILTKFASVATSVSAPSAAGTASSSAASPSTAIVQLDNRTNSIVVRDFPDNIERMKKLVEILDTQTPQVLIEAKIVEANEQFSNDINGGFGIGGTGSTSFFASLNGGDPLGPLVSGANPGAGIAGSSATPSNGFFGFSPDMSFIPGVQALNAAIHLAEVENQAKVVTSPKTVVLNKQKATIVESQPVLVPVPSQVVPGGTVTSGSSVQQANISLAVTPTVTNDGSVQLELTVQRDIPLPLAGGLTAIGNRNLSTLVLVDSGSTLVIGGIYSMSVSHVDEGIPFLRKIPILGALFGHTSDVTTRSELFIFVTPKIINSREAGLNS